MLILNNTIKTGFLPKRSDKVPQESRPSVLQIAIILTINEALCAVIRSEFWAIGDANPISIKPDIAPAIKSGKTI